MGTTLDKLDRRLREELHREFDSQVVDTPPPHRARYGRLDRSYRVPMPLRTAALVTAVFAVGVLAGLVYNARAVPAPGPGRQVGAVPVVTPPPANPATATQTAPAARASAPATQTPRAGRRPTAPPSAPAARPAFADTFASDPLGANPPAGWHVDDGQWDGVVDDGGHVLRHSGTQGASHLSAGSPQWADYVVSADVTTGLLDLGFAGVAARYQGPADHYECGLGVGGQVQLWLVKGGARTLLGVSVVVSLDLSAHHTVALEVRASGLTCSLDGSPLVRATDTTFAAGRIALVTSAGEAAEFGNVRASG
jgi:hypothetical protein